jgi:4-hydroxybenzoate polyprenyltransferase
MTISSGSRAGIYTALIILGLVIAISLMLALTLNQTVFIAIFTLYMTGCSAFLFAYLMINKEKLKDDMKFTISEYMTMFNLILSFFVFIMCFVIPFVTKKKDNMGAYRQQW